MPKKVDHEQRRQEIAAAVWRIAAERGLPAATLREVAATAGVSMRLVQYYFGTTARMRRYALDLITARAAERMRARLAAIDPTPEAIVRACLLELLPSDDDSRLMTRVHAAYHAAALHDPDLAPDGDDPGGLLERALATQLAHAEHPTLEARGLAAMMAGLTPAVLLGRYTVEEATAVVEHHLTRLFDLKRG
ncbi:transcriptional regulator [Virgisporangium aliadipatigenens]|uniref:Transcriptional regulator n=1 Tax=Virgisporangium aliadipatigenens TaxID=741659 RepID=A0A8J4DR64_9ACTN|nr:TetR/AcrR family transcriptional regulator [Virgisporangium aliadipatigenens]GIJ46453.1 transcriptional regulator [Virgisporangium aliadipatigenens]